MCDLRWTQHGWRMRLWQAEGRSATRSASRPRLSKRVQLAKGRHQVCSAGRHGRSGSASLSAPDPDSGARHRTFLPGGRSLVLLRGETQHKNLWLIDLETGAERQLTNLTPDFATSTSLRMVVKLSSNECRSAPMWRRRWISPDDNPASTRRRGRPATVLICGGIRVWAAPYFLSMRTTRSRAGAAAAFKYLAKNSSTRDRVKVLVSKARSNALSSGFRSRVNLLETRPASVKLM